MHIEILGLQHQDLLKPKLASLRVAISEYSFANMYLFRNVHEYEVVFAKQIYIRGKTRDGLVYYMPTVHPTKVSFLDLQQSLGESGIVLFPIAEQWLGEFPSPTFIHESLSQDMDYIYTLEQLRHYPGRALTGQRNQVNQFKRLYTCTSKALTTETISDGVFVLDQWCKDDPDSDCSECLEALRLHDILGLNGMIYYVDEQPAALIIGEPLTSDVYVVHFAKGNLQFKGIYQYVYQHFAQGLSDTYQLINLEQDLGVPGMQKAKTSYHPIKQETKWRVYRKQFKNGM